MNNNFYANLQLIIAIRFNNSKNGYAGSVTVSDAEKWSQHAEFKLRSSMLHTLLSNYTWKTHESVFPRFPVAMA